MAAPTRTDDLRCSQVSAALDNDPAGSASAFTSFLLIASTGAFSRVAADDAADRHLDPQSAAWVKDNGDGLRPFAVRSAAGRHGAPLPPFLAGRVDDGDRMWAWDRPPRATALHTIPSGIAPGAVERTGPLVGVCTNGSRDRCCAMAGRPIAQRLLPMLGDESVVEISHLGGHRFAGTLLVLPWGYSYGLLDPDAAAAVVTDLLDGLVHPRHLRGRASSSPAAQAAEAAWRRELGPAAPGAVSITGEHAVDGGTVVDALVDGRAESLVVGYRTGATVSSTVCGGKPFVTGRWEAARPDPN